ncbi:MAG: sugar ABC transporter ATP-binding protein [Candidatus Sumerlaeota bacterium]|nr:sugar ABC transporter ATP-binding protein [Candidatus Sumerlaeota bacterium]
MLELNSISKSFPGVKALDDVSLRFEPGEIHALVGENGAGKSTAIKIITGIYQPDSGQIIYDGKPLHFRTYHDSLRAGIDIVFQEIQIIPESSIAENIMLDKMIAYGSTGIVNWKAVNATAKRYMDMVGLSFPPTMRMRRLSAAHKQLTQIAKALAANARVLLLDEPTSSLTDHEAQNLFRILRELKSQGVTIIFVSHKFEEVFALCDKVSVLRDGKFVGTRAISELTIPDLVQMMIGRDCKDEHLGALDVDRTVEVMKADHIKRAEKADDVSFTLYEGEVLGFYGLVGAGRTEMARIIIGEDRMDSGALYVRGQRTHIRNVGDSLYRYRIGYVTENRKEEGLLLKSPVQTNITITIWRNIINRFTRCINPRAEVDIARRMVGDLSIKTPDLNQRTENLSGGNQQKICIAKWLAADCDILIIDEPTVGVDIGAKEQIHRLIWELAKKRRKSIILISSDMPEIIKVSSRILVFKEQRIVGEITGVDEKNKTYEEVSTAIGQYLA